MTDLPGKVRAVIAPLVRDGLILQIILRTGVIVLLMSVLLMAFVFIAARKADQLSIDRQQHLIETVLEQNFRAVAHDQEASTVWDESVEQMQARPLDYDWLDANLGIWIHTYYGHDEVFIVDARDRIVYAMQGGRRVDPEHYGRTHGKLAAPLITELRTTLRRDEPVRRDSNVLTSGAVDLADIHGHPAIVSVKPIVSDTGEIVQAPGSEYLHVSIRYLDGAFVADLARRYELTAARFSRTAPSDFGASEVALRTRSGKLLGYIVWDPFRPGQAMLGEVLPVLAVALLSVFGIVVFLLRRISHGTLQLTAAKIRAQHLANHDPLTGLANRALFDQRLSAELSQLRITGRTLALLYIDLDHFKNVNDHLGHPTGDLLICRLAQLLRQIAPGDVVARLGGDEFAIIHVSNDASSTAERLCAELQKVLSKPIDLGHGEVLIGASIGIALAPAHATGAVDLVRKADIALYDAKLAGRRRHSFFTHLMGDRIRDRNEIETELREAMRTGEGLNVHYQPFFAARTGELLGAEALIRWDHPVRGVMSPETFVPIAEECGLIETLSEWVLEQACLIAASWPTGTISVNLSPVQLRNASLAERVYAILRRTRLSPGRLELEITETSFLESSEKARSNLGWLRDIGVGIALDDFGTGYSSFKHLRGFDIDRIKIDQSFVAAIDIGNGGSPVIQAIVELARVSGLRTTAEGVETEQQRRFLTSIGCDTLQGFFLSEPLPESEIGRLFFEIAQGE